MTDDGFDLEFLREIQEGFLTETDELLEEFENCFLQLEKNPGDLSIVENIFRIAHNIKGSAKAVGFDGLSKFAHTLENLLVAINKGKIVASADVVDILLQSGDILKRFVAKLKVDSSATVETVAVEELINYVLENKNENVKKEVIIPVVEQPNSDKEEVVHKDIGTILVEDKIISEEQLDKAVQTQNKKLGEILVDQGVLNQEQLEKSLEKQEIINKGPPKKVEEYIRLPLGKIDGLLDYFGEQVILQSVLDHSRHDLKNNAELITKTILQLNKITYDLQQTAISLRLMNLKNLFNKMQRIVRDTTRELGKDIFFKMEGEETELDKTILDELSQPVTHMIRNSVDHGIEMPAERLAIGKKARGTITMHAYHRGGFFYLEIIDDGKGLDVEKIKSKAISLGLIKGDQELSEEEILALVFRSGFSTKDQATDVSGRGVGMDAIKTSISKLQGGIEIKSKVNEGTFVQIKLPLTLAIFNGLILRIGRGKYVIPNSEIREIHRVNFADFVSVGDKERLIKINDRVFPVVNLESVMKEKISVSGEESGFVIIVESHGREFALTAKSIDGQQRIVIKKLGEEIEGLPGIAGGTILGDGKIALILEINEIIKLYKQQVSK